MKTKKLRIKGDDEYIAICVALAQRSCFFSCMPLPDSLYEIEFKPNEGIEKIIQDTVAEVIKEGSEVWMQRIANQSK